jgi:S-(hydroxymethyl)glutathione dehydrogenase/alcohol dehydrogenase
MTLQIQNTVAAILVKSENELVVDEIELPKELFTGQVLVEVITSGICGAQINEIDAVKGPDKYLPHLLGHEGFARVIEVGPGVTTLTPGDQVVMHWRPGSGIQSKTPIYNWRGKQLNAGWVTTLNQHAVVSENRLTRLPNAVHDKYLMPLLGCALTTSLGVLENEAKIGFRDSLLVFGAGGVGLLIVKLAKMLGVHDITVVDIYPEKLIRAKNLGASNILLFKDKLSAAKDIQEIYRESLPTVAIDTSGNTDAIEICYELSSPEARVILVGVPKAESRASLYTLPLHFGKLLKGSEGGQSKPEKDIPDLLKLIENKTLTFEDFPTNRFELSEVNEALHLVKSGGIGRMIVDFNVR